VFKCSDPQRNLKWEDPLHGHILRMKEEKNPNEGFEQETKRKTKMGIRV
jgi:hypothetical protein